MRRTLPEERKSLLPVNVFHGSLRTVRSCCDNPFGTVNDEVLLQGKICKNYFKLEVWGKYLDFIIGQKKCKILSVEHVSKCGTSSIVKKFKYKMKNEG